MTNATLKAQIEKLANVKIMTSTYKAGNDGYEGYASAYPADCQTFVHKGKTRCIGHAHTSTQSFGCRTAADATTKALNRLAAALNLTIRSDAVETRAQADFDARTK